MGIWMFGKSLMKQDYLINETWWNKIDETRLSNETDETRLSMEDMTDADYIHATIVCKNFEIKHLGEYPDFYHPDIVLEHVRKTSLKIYHLDPVKFI